jgi:hypothetical protein
MQTYCKLIPAGKSTNDFVCSVCGSKVHVVQGNPLIPCDGSIASRLQREEAEKEATLQILAKASESWQRLDTGLPMPSALTQTLAEWRDANYPERGTHEECLTAIAAIPCKHRSTGGFCRKIGCGKDPSKNVACVWLYRMATAGCRAGKFAARSQK